MAYDYSKTNWDGITYNSMGGGQRIKASAARKGATYEGALAAYGKPGAGMNVAGYNPNIGRAQDSQDAGLAKGLGVANPGALKPQQPAANRPGGMLLTPTVTPRRSLQAMPGGSPYEDPANKAKQQELDQLRGYLTEFRGTDAEAGYQRGIDRLSRELEDAYKPRQSVTPKGYSESDTSWGQDYGPTPGEAAISRERAAATTPAQSKDGETNNNVGKLTPRPLPTSSNYAGVQNRFDETYTGRLLARARGQAEAEAAAGAQRLRESMAERGMSQAGMSGFEAQGLRDIEMNRQNNLSNLSREAQLQSAQLASNFDMQRAGALDAFDMNVGNLGLGYSADARAGMLLPGQLTAQQLDNERGAFQNKILSNDAYYYTSPEAANNRAIRDNLQTSLIGSQYEGASIENAMRGLSFQQQQALLDTAIRQGLNDGTIKAAEAEAAKQIAAQSGSWWETSGIKNWIRALLVGGGALAGSLIPVPGVGTAAGTMVGGGLAGALTGAAVGGSAAGAIK
jgi:hypothetical protein